MQRHMYIHTHICLCIYVCKLYLIYSTIMTMNKAMILNEGFSKDYI